MHHQNPQSDANTGSHEQHWNRTELVVDSVLNDGIIGTATVSNGIITLVYSAGTYTLQTQSLEEIISALAKRGCADLTTSINLAAYGNFAVAGGGFCDVYRGQLYDGRKIAIKSLRVYDGPEIDSQKQKILKVSSIAPSWHRKHSYYYPVLPISMRLRSCINGQNSNTLTLYLC
jgi:hypothetical protein